MWILDGLSSDRERRQLTRTNDQRIRFLSKFELSITWDDKNPTIFWRGPSSPGQPGGYSEIAKGSTLEEAIDRAMDRWEKKHKRKFE